MDHWIIAQQLMVSLGLGMLIGLQRERSGSALGGIRTFPLVTLFGTICGQLAVAHGGYLLAAGLGALALVTFIPNIVKLREGQVSGVTTEVAMLLLFGLGAFLVTGPMPVVVVTAGAVALLLHWKTRLHGFARAIGDDDMRAIMRFVLISMVILPILPDKAYGPFETLNPFEIWLMVVLIVAMSLSGYVAYKVFEGHAGVLMTGLIGGFISSTAATVSAARDNGKNEGSAGLVSLIIMIASVASVIRVMGEIAVVAPQQTAALLPPLAAFLAALMLIAGTAYFLTAKKEQRLPLPKNPAALKQALVFATIYAAIKFAVAAAKEHFGSSGLYVVAVISGLTDMDAITLSAARMTSTGRVEADMAWRMILIACLANLAFKGAAVAALANRQLSLRVILLFAISIVSGGLILWLWP